MVCQLAIVHLSQPSAILSVYMVGRVLDLVFVSVCLTGQGIIVKMVNKTKYNTLSSCLY